MPRTLYRKRATQTVVAVQLALETTGFQYMKWGSLQTCKPGDWIVDDHGDVHTVDRESFARTYRAVSRGLYLKTSHVWAERAAGPGHIATKEGATAYATGDYLVANESDGGDAYAVSAERFEAMYERVPPAADQ